MPQPLRRIALPGAAAAVLVAFLLPAFRVFDGALLAPSDLQRTTDPSGDSPLSGQSVHVEGVVTAVSPHGFFYYLGDPGGGAWGGVRVDGAALARRVGERVMVEGTVAEVSNETRLLELSASSRGPGDGPSPARITVAQLRNGEEWEGVLVEIADVTVDSFTSDFGEFSFSDRTGSGGEVDDEFFHSYVSDPDDTFEWIRGPVGYGFGDFHVEPRSDRDFHGWKSARGNDAQLIVAVHDERGREMPAKVTLFRADGATLRLGPDDRAEGSGDVAYLPGPPRTVPVPAGTYDWVVSRGIEYGLAEGQVTVSPGGEARIDAVLVRELDTRGWISGDYHLHSAPSNDTVVPVGGRIRSLAGEGVEWAVATDHNVVTDYAPVIRSLGMERWILGSIGEEITTNVFGHFNSWPLEPGAEPVAWQGLSPAGLFAAARTDPGLEVVQVNHPVVPDWGNQYYQVFAISRFTGEPDVPGFSFDFDAVELFNGRFLDEGLANFETWMRMLNNGHRVTATGNSDSHNIVFREPGYPRNYVASGADEPNDAREDELVAGVLAGRVFVTYGPALDFSANGGRVGDLVAAPDGTVRLRARVQAASWLDVTEARIYANGRILATLPLDSSAPGPFDAVLEWEDRPAADTWYLVFVDGTGDLAPVRRGPEFRPLAFTNPVWVDVDGNGGFDPPGNVADAVTGAELDEVDASGVPLRIGDWVSMTGCATTGTRFGDPVTGIFYLEEGTGGVQIREAVGSITAVQRGDEVWAGGYVTQSLGETILSECLIEVRSQGGACGDAGPVATGAIAAAGTGMEALEGRVVRIAGADVTAGTWPANGAEGAVTVDDGSGPVALYVPRGVVVPAEAATLADFDFTALVTQRDFSAPFLGGYRLTLRDGADLFPGAAAATGVASGAGAAGGRLEFGAPRPNPFSGSVRVPLLGAARGRAPRVEVVDVTGRRVRSLAPEPAAAAAIVWDGRDSAGRAAAAGVYYLRLLGTDDPRTVRVVKLK
jgi:hypothetical protein